MRGRAMFEVVVVLLLGCGPASSAPHDAAAADAREGPDTAVGEAARVWEPTPSAHAAPVAPSVITSRDGRTAFVLDVDASALWRVDLADRTVTPIALPTGALPSGGIEDALGRVHVVLRGAGALATLAPGADRVTLRHVCSEPRGIAARGDELLVACADGHLVTASTNATVAPRSTWIADDLRDVAVAVPGGRVFVSRFRSAEVLEVDPTTGAILSRSTPDTQTQPDPLAPSDGSTTPTVPYEPRVAWSLGATASYVMLVHQLHRAAPIPERGIAIDDPIAPSYAGMPAPNTCDTIVQNARSVLDLDTGTWTTTVATLRGAIDGADETVAHTGDGGYAPIENGGTIGCPGTNDLEQPHPVAWLDRAPFVLHYGAGIYARSIALDPLRVADPGRELFFATSPSGVACASCHPEGGDDGHVWRQLPGVAVRTQNVRGGALDAPPLHWEGDLADFDGLLHEVWSGRMGGHPLDTEDASALAAWIRSLPPLAGAESDDADAVARGATLFASFELGCADCHDGSRTLSRDVGTGGEFQVPSLAGVVYRAPYMHGGCAPTLRARFTGDASCTGGDFHGHTPALTATQIDDLVAYLRTR
jgi:cytochrome c553